MSKDKADAAQKGGEIQKSEGGMPSLAPAELQGMVEIEVSVTAEDKAVGVRNNCYECPFALAFGRWLAPGYVAFAGPFNLRIYSRKGPSQWFTDTPSHVNDWMEEFDAGNDPPLISVHLSVPAQFIREDLRSITA